VREKLKNEPDFIKKEKTLIYFGNQTTTLFSGLKNFYYLITHFIYIPGIFTVPAGIKQLTRLIYL
jgi:hypothetical protein